MVKCHLRIFNYYITNNVIYEFDDLNTTSLMSAAILYLCCVQYNCMPPTWRGVLIFTVIACCSSPPIIRSDMDLHAGPPVIRS